jgi:hypothetical protein
LAEQEIKQIGEGESPAEYTRERAIASFQQIVEIHGWQVTHHVFFRILHGPSLAATDFPPVDLFNSSLCRTPLSFRGLPPRKSREL